MRHRVTFLPQGRITSTPDGGTLLSAAHWAGVPIESTCGGCGTCGKCRVRLREGSAAIAPKTRSGTSTVQTEAAVIVRIE